jgi:hypothetical protein
MATLGEYKESVDSGAKRPCHLAKLRAIPDGTDASAAATDWLITQLHGASGMSKFVPASLPEVFLRIFAADAAPALCNAVTLESTICEAMTAEEASPGGAGLPRVARLCRLATALWLVLAPVAGGGGMDCISQDGSKRLSKAVQPFRSAIYAQVCRRGGLMRSIAALGRVFAKAEPAADLATGAEPSTDSRLLIAAPLAGILRAVHMWPISSDTGPGSSDSVWSIDHFANTKSLLAVLSATSGPRLGSVLEAAIRACLTPAVVEERGLASSLDLVSSLAGVPAAAVLQQAVAAMGAEASTTRASAGAAADSASGEALPREAVDELCRGVVSAGVAVAGITCGHMTGECVASAVESLAAHPGRLCQALGSVSGLRLAVQSTLHMHLQERRGVAQATSLQAAARVAVALASAVALPVTSLLPDGAGASAVAGPIALLATSAHASDAGGDAGGDDAAGGAAGSPWSVSDSLGSVTSAARVSLSGLDAGTMLRLPPASQCSTILTRACVTPRQPPAELPGFREPEPEAESGGAAVAPGSRSMVGLRLRLAGVRAWTGVADCLPVRDVVSLSSTCRALSSILALPESAARSGVEQLPSIVTAGATASLSRAALPSTASHKSTVAAAEGLCRREKVSPPPEVASPALASEQLHAAVASPALASEQLHAAVASPALASEQLHAAVASPALASEQLHAAVASSSLSTSPLARHGAASPLSRVYWSRRVARNIVYPVKGDPQARLNAAVIAWSTPDEDGGITASAAGGSASGRAQISASSPHLRADLRSPSFPTPWTATQPEASDPAALFTAPARAGRASRAGILGAGVEALVRAADVVDGCVASLAAAAVSGDASAPSRVASALFRPMHDAAAIFGAVSWIGVGVSLHASLIAELYEARRTSSGTSSARASGGSSADDPLALLRGASLIVEQWCNRRLRADKARMPPAALQAMPRRAPDKSGVAYPPASASEVFRAYAQASQALAARLLPALADAEAPASQSHVLISAERQTLAGKVEMGSVGHPALGAALVRLLLARALPSGELGWCLTQAAVGAAVVPSLSAVGASERTTETLLRALLASVAVDAEVSNAFGCCCCWFLLFLFLFLLCQRPRALA